MRNKLSKLFLVLLLCPQFLISETREKKTVPPKRPVDSYKEESKTIRLALGAKAQSSLVRRGATLYGSWQITPILYLGLFNERLIIFGTSAEYVHPVLKDQIRGRLKLASFSDEPLFTTGDSKGLRNSRASTWELTSTIECFFPERYTNTVSAELRYTKDLKAHWGDQVELSGKVTLGRFKMETVGTRELPLFQPQLFVTLGFGGERNNLYWYGPQATKTGFNYLEAGLFLLAPSRYDPQFPAITVSVFQILGDRNKSGSLVSDKVSGIHATGTLAFSVL